jgi:hypothetical protein
MVSMRVNGIIHSAMDRHPFVPASHTPEPFEIILESPALAPLALQRAAQLSAVTEIIRHYRRLICLRGKSLTFRPDRIGGRAIPSNTNTEHADGRPDVCSWITQT